MSDDHSVEAVKKEVKVYIGVFVALMALTVITVQVSYLRLPVALAVLIGLFIATLKGSFVALIFMHLKSEKRWVYGILLMTIIFFIACLLLPLLMYLNGGWMNVS